jgi:phosphinothricin acetyltransferase
MPDYVVRPAFQEDIRWVRPLYAYWVTTSAYSFETEPPSPEEMVMRWANVVSAGLPYVVATPAADPSRVLGYAYATPFRDRAAYAGTVETSVYVAPGHERRGIGKALMLHLLRELVEIGTRQAVAVIGDSANRGSIRLHEWAGYRVSGQLLGVGHKFGRDVDVVLMQRGFAPPKPGSSHQAIVTYVV